MYPQESTPASSRCCWRAVFFSLSHCLLGAAQARRHRCGHCHPYPSRTHRFRLRCSSVSIRYRKLHLSRAGMQYTAYLPRREEKINQQIRTQNWRIRSPRRSPFRISSVSGTDTSRIAPSWLPDFPSIAHDLTLNSGSVPVFELVKSRGGSD